MKTPEFESSKLTPEQFKAKNRRAFLSAALAAGAGLAGWISLARLERDRGLPWLLRRANELNDSFWKATFDPDAVAAPVYADGKPVRINGDVGMLNTIDYGSYKLTVLDPRRNEPLVLTLDEIKKLPAVRESFEFNCIEGWTQPVSCKGVRFSDFMQAFDVGKGFAFAGMTTIDRGYYVSWDAKSLLHPQTVLCYEMNGSELRPENGAPLRVLASVKYGVKQIKQLGTIAFAQSPPADFWAERGYSDYLGL